MRWLSQHAQVIAAIGTEGMFFIWLLYLHLIYRDFRRSRRTSLLIHEGQRMRRRSPCLLVNMSQHVVHISCVLVVAETADGRFMHELTDHVGTTGGDGDGRGGADRDAVDEPAGRKFGRAQGPLEAGSFFVLGDFEALYEHARHGRRLSHASDGASARDGALGVVEVRVVAEQGNETEPVGARRRFVLGPAEAPRRVRPVSLVTEQMHSRRQRREVRRWLDLSMQV